MLGEGANKYPQSCVLLRVLPDVPAVYASSNLSISEEAERRDRKSRSEEYDFLHLRHMSQNIWRRLSRLSP